VFRKMGINSRKQLRGVAAGRGSVGRAGLDFREV
jgi:hypothetical protein